MEEMSPAIRIRPIGEAIPDRYLEHLPRLREHGDILCFETPSSPDVLYTMTANVWQAMELVKLGAEPATTLPAPVIVEKIGPHAATWTLPELIVGICALYPEPFIRDVPPVQEQAG